ncbi:ABC transporter permease [Paenibacillus xylaniclasticus]|uniref:ABC transporter permease n=1 Tax=Paenibacillus xylaniclasticus TaxID=588083 RepID=UPI000FDC9F47|nr:MULTISPECIES: ABC transporter permease [Paenibacillus]GFN33158.1 ribose import permease protein RbsC [Paenibacillus curdlanolyticus]
MKNHASVAVGELEAKKRFSLASIFQKNAIIFVWIGIIILYSLIIPDIFPTWGNFSMMFSSKAVLVVLALAIMIPLVAGDYDMSAASILVLSSMIVATANVKLGLPIGVSVVLAILIGTLIGFINGAIVSKLNINPFIVTMGVSTLLNGITLWISGSRTITGIDSSLQKAVIIGRIFDISYVFFYALILCGILFYILEFTAIGKKILMVGRGNNVARLSGIKVDRIRWGCFTASGFVSAIGGVLYAGTLGSADPSSGLSFLMLAFAAVFLGSTCIKPGRFNPIGCIIAVYFLVTGTTGLSLMGISTFIQDIFYGLALVLSVMSSVLVKRLQEKQLKKKKLAVVQPGASQTSTSESA